MNFKKFSTDDLGVTNQVKASVYRGIRSSLVEHQAVFAELVDVVLPKNATAFIAKGANREQILIVDDEILFYCERDGPWMPTLRLVHRYPNILPHVQVDKGAIKFVLSGANIMCRGLTSPGSKMDVDLPAGAACIVVAEGKEHALAIGVLTMSTAEIRSANKGIGVDNVHVLGDGLWTSSKTKLNQANE